MVSARHAGAWYVHSMCLACADLVGGGALVGGDHEHLLCGPEGGGQQRSLQQCREQHRLGGELRHNILVMKHGTAVARDRHDVPRLEALHGVYQCRGLRFGERLTLERLQVGQPNHRLAVRLVQVRVGARELRHGGRVDGALGLEHADIR